MKIVWSVPVFSEGLGSGRGDMVRARALIHALRSAGHQVRVVEARDRPGRGVEESLYRKVGGRLLPAPVRLAARDAAWWWRSRGHGGRVAGAAREEDADLLVETQVHGVVSGVVAARSTGLPLILDDVSPAAEIGGLGAGLPVLGRWAFGRQSAAAALLVSPSVRIRSRIEGEGHSSPPVTVILNGVDLEAHRQASRMAGRRALGLGEELVIAFVGSFQPWHDGPLLVRAFADLPATRSLRLLLVGDGPGRGPTLAQARDLGVRGRIVAPGAVRPDRVPDMLAACDMAVLAGTNDYGHPMKLVEYAAAGLPSVAPDVGPVREMVRDQESGLLFAAGDAASLTRTLARLVADPELRRRLGATARATVAEDAAWSARGRRLAEALEGVLAERRSGSPVGGALESRS